MMESFSSPGLAIKQPAGGVVDVGPGFGHFLEVVRDLGCPAFGIEATTGDGGMGDEYLALSRLLIQRQRLPVMCIGFRNWLALVRKDSGVAADKQLINFQGSWAQCWSHHLGGVPHHVNHNAGEQYWLWGDTLTEAWTQAFITMCGLLLPEGHILIVANRTGDAECQRRYDQEIVDCADSAGLECAMREGGYVHKFRRAAWA
jgi:hypothetical protein